MTKFTKRTTAPSKTSKYYYKDNIFYQSGFGMPNCTCYAWGRWYELLGVKPKLCTRNAENWYNYTQDGYKRGKTPKLGAIIVWSKGKIGVAKDGAGHVAVVEEIYSDGSFLTSNSASGGSNFYTKKINKNCSLSGYKFEGFIYTPVTFENNTTVQYQTYDNVKNKWLPKVKSNTNDYAGLFGHGVSGLKIEKLTYRVHDKVKNKWLPYVTGTSDYAGILTNDIDGIQVKGATYRVHLKGGKWLPWVSKVDNTSNGYAGIYGKVIDAVQIKIS